MLARESVQRYARTGGVDHEPIASIRFVRAAFRRELRFKAKPELQCHHDILTGRRSFGSLRLERCFFEVQIFWFRSGRRVVFGRRIVLAAAGANSRRAC
jgi:hypothetical protein